MIMSEKNTHTGIILSMPVLYVILGSAEKIGKKIKKYMYNDSCVDVVGLFSDGEEYVCREIPGDREEFLSAFDLQREDIEKKLEEELFSVINSFKKTAFERDAVQISYIFNACENEAAALEFTSKITQKTFASAFRDVYEDFFCLYDESLYPGDEGKRNDINKYLTFTELEKIVPPLEKKDMTKTCYILGNCDSKGRLSEFDFDTYLKCICSFTALKTGVSRENDNRFLGNEFREDIFKINCREKYPEGRFFSLGMLSIEKDDELIRNIILDRLTEKVLTVNERLDTENEVKTLTRFTTAVITAEEAVEECVDKRGEDIAPEMFFTFVRNHIDVSAGLGSNADTIKRIYGRAIDKFVDANAESTIDIEAVSLDFKKELNEKLVSFSSRTGYSVNDAIAFLTEDVNSLKNICLEKIETSSKEVAERKAAFERFKARKTDDGNIDQKAATGESMLIFTVAASYCEQYLAIKKSEVVNKIFKAFLDVINETADKYVRSYELVKELKKEYSAVVAKKTASLKLRPDDIVKKNAVKFYTDLTDDAAVQFKSGFLKYFSDVNSALFGVDLGVKELKEMINERTNAAADFLYENCPVLKADFSEECRQRLSGSAESVNSMIKEEILADRGYFSNTNNFTGNEFETIGILGNNLDPTPRYLLGKEGIVGDKHAFLDEAIDNDMTVIYIKGTQKTENIASYERWKTLSGGEENV